MAAFLTWSYYFSRRNNAKARKTPVLMLGIGFGAAGLALAAIVYGSRTTAGVVLAAVLVVAVSYVRLCAPAACHKRRPAHRSPAPPRVHQAYGHLPADTTNDKGGTNSGGKMSLFGPVMAVLGIATSALVTAAVVGNSDFDTGWQQQVANMAAATAWLSVAWWVLYFVEIDFIGWSSLRATPVGRLALQVGILLETAAFVGSGLLLGSLPDATSPAYAMLATAIALKGLAWTGGHVGVHAPETLEI